VPLGRVRSAGSKGVGGQVLEGRAEGGAAPPHRQGVAVERDRESEVITLRAVAGDEFLLLGPGRSAAREDVYRTLITVRADAVPLQVDRASCTYKRDLPSEVVIHRAVVADALVWLGLGGSAAREDVDRALNKVRANGGAMQARRQSVAFERDRGSEVITESAVVGDEFLLLGPGRSAAREDVCRTLISVRADAVPL